jgi:predicted RNA-binding protein with RPS1 domain
LAQSSGVPIPDGPPSAVAADALLALAGAAERIDATSNTYVLSYLIAIMHEGGALLDNQESMRHSAGQVNSSVAQASADQLAATITGAERDICSLPDLRRALAQALGRCPQTSAVLDALRLLDDGVTVSPPPPPRIAAFTPASPAHPGPVADAGATWPGSPSAQDRRAAPGSGRTLDTRGDPWTAFCGEHAIGDVVHGRVKGTQGYGAFVNLEQGISGLVHSSEIPDKQGRQISDMFRVGQPVAVKIIKIDAGNQRIDLSMMEVPQELPPADDAAQQARDGPGETPSRRDQDAKIFLEAVREFLVLRSSQVSRPSARF